MKNIRYNGIFVETYYRGLFMILPDNFAVKISERNGKHVFGKLTYGTISNSITKKDAIAKYKLSDEYLTYFEQNHKKFRVIWNTIFESHKPGDIYAFDDSKFYSPWNLVCHQIGSYRRYGGRSVNDSWKLAVAGLNPNIFKNLK